EPRSTRPELQARRLVSRCPVYPRSAVKRGMPSPVVTFDVGQTIVELDIDFLAARLRERGHEVAPRALAEAAPIAWQRYDELVDVGASHPWHELMTVLMTR